MNGTRPLIEVSGLAKRYRRLVAVDDVSLAVNPGEIFGLLGPDGAGKSTIMQVLAGVLLPDRGRVTLAGIDVLRDPEAAKARIGYMPQGLGLNLYDDLTVDEHLEFFADLRGVPSARFGEHRALLLEMTRLAPATRRQARHLSGGMRQKLGLASSLIHMPEILLLDEPTTGVDPLSRQDFWQIINRLSRKRKITVFLTTPYLDEAERCHRVALMHRGRLLTTGAPEDLKARAQRNAEPVTMEDVFVGFLTSGDERSPSTVEATKSDLQAAGAVARSANGPAIEVEGLTRRFGGFTAVDDVTFAVRAGEIFGFLGPNGAGKTTTIKMLSGILRPTAGRGWVAGHDILDQADAIKHTIGYMSQRFSLYPDLTVRENLGLYARIYGLRGRRQRAREDAVVLVTGLQERLGTLARDLPLGIRQRLALAGALLHEPPVLFLDEPTSGVDPLARARFWELLGSLSRDHGVTILVSTHYMDEAQRCDRLSLMHQGKLVALGTPLALREQAARRRGTVLEVSAADFRAVVDVLEPQYPDLSLAGSRLHVFSHDAASDRRRIEETLLGAGIGAVQVRDVVMSMDDVFATLIGSGR